MKGFFAFKKIKAERGFTLIELMIVFMVMGIMASVLLFNFQTFNGLLQYDNISQDIALRIVEAQKAAITGKINPNFVGRDMKPSYGVYFVSAHTAGSANEQFVYFTDIPGIGTGSTATTGDKIYDPPTGVFVCNGATVSGNECVSVTTITTGEYIDNICYKVAGSGISCAGSTGADLDVTFVRPYPNASIIIHKPVTSTTPIVAQSACIELASPIYPNAKRTIMVSDLGQIGSYPVAATSTSLACQTWP